MEVPSVKASCHCGAVQFEVRQPPSHVTECNCSICRSLGTLWSYYPVDDVTFVEPVGPTVCYQWGERAISFHSCATCGCTTHWVGAKPDSPPRMGINARLLIGLHPDDVTVERLEFGGEGRFWTHP